MIYELGEGAILKRFDARDMKGFISDRSDTWRNPYARAQQTVRRQVSFAMTTNDTEYLVDETGNRRYWPVRCQSVNLDGLQRDILQLYAEALVRHQEGRRRWPTDEEDKTIFRPEQGQREVEDPMEDLLRSKLTENSYRPSEILEELGLKADTRGGTWKRIAAILTSKMSWSKRQDGSGRMLYHAPTSGGAEAPVLVEAMLRVAGEHGFEGEARTSGDVVIIELRASEPDDDEIVEAVMGV